MSAAAPDPKDLRSPRIPGWALVFWLALTGYLFNLWVTYGLQWPGLLAYEVPGREALQHGRVWTLLTYVFVNGSARDISDWVISPFSILLLFIVARLIEADLPRRQFLWLCASCALAGAAVWLPLHWAGGEQLTAGSTTLVLGLLAYWCFTTPAESTPVRLLFVGVARPQVFFWIALALETGTFLVFELPQVFGIPGMFRGDMESSAYLGAMFAGWAFARAQRRAPARPGLPPLDEVVLRHPQPQPVHASAARAHEPEAAAAPARAMPATRRELRDEVDRILDKIIRDGLEALTAQERKILHDAKNLLKK